MTTYFLTQRAKSDLVSIARFTEKRWGRKQRYIYIKQFDDSFHALSNSPEIGNNCDYIKEGYQKLPQGSHIIFYRVISSKHIQIVRILHKNMDVLSKFGDA